VVCQAAAIRVNYFSSNLSDAFDVSEDYISTDFVVIIVNYKQGGVRIGH